MDVSKLVEKLEKELEFWRNFYGEELVKDLGKEFSFGHLNTGSPYTKMGNYFFPVIYKGKPFGVTLPFRDEKQAVFAFYEDKKICEHVSEVFKKKGYKVTFSVYPITSDDLSFLAIDEKTLAVQLDEK